MDEDQQLAINGAIFDKLVICQKQRDELLAALRKIEKIEDNMFGGDWDEIHEAREIAKAAIAKCES